MEQNNKLRIRERSLTLLADLSLIGVSSVWGATFVITKNLLLNFHVAEILLGRFLVATLFTLFLFSKLTFDFKSFQRGFLPGICLFTGYFFQSWGLVFTTPARSGFITGLSVVLVPFVSWIILNSKPPFHSYIGVALSTLGLFFILSPRELTTTLGENWLWGDALTLCGAAAYALQIVLVEKLSGKTNSLSMAFGEFSMVAILSLGTLISTSPNRVTNILTARPLVIAFLGIVATALAFITQKIAQKYTPSTQVAIIFASEPVFAAIFANLLWNETFTPRTLAGCVLILGGILSCEAFKILTRHFQFPQPLNQTPTPQHKEDL